LEQDALSLEIEHDLSFFDSAQGKRVAQNTLHILSQVISYPSKSIIELALTSDADLKQIWEWNHSIPPNLKHCARQLFGQQSLKTPNAQAISSWDGSLTFTELEKLSARLGGHLPGMGVQPGMVIPICFEKCKWTIVAMIAVLKAGAAFTTLDPVQPTDRLVDTVVETRSKIILVSASQAERFGGHGCNIVSDIPGLSQQDSVPTYSKASLAVGPEDLSYVAFTRCVDARAQARSFKEGPKLLTGILLLQRLNRQAKRRSVPALGFVYIDYDEVERRFGFWVWIWKAHHAIRF
jgi:non-ribosomal peptide synthetase component F